MTTLTLIRKKLIAVGVMVTGLLLGGFGLMIGAGIAKADPAHATHGTVGDKDGEEYALDLAEVNEGMLGLVPRDKAIWSATEDGNRLCFQRNSKTEAEMIANMVSHGWVLSHATVRVQRAEFHFCPEKAVP